MIFYFNAVMSADESPVAFVMLSTGRCIANNCLAISMALARSPSACPFASPSARPSFTVLIRYFLYLLCYIRKIILL